MSKLSVARAVPVEWGCHRETSSGECITASTPGGLGSPPLEKLEPEAALTNMHATAAPPTGACVHDSTQLRQYRHFTTNLFQGRACSLSALVGKAPGMQCSCEVCSQCEDHPLWFPNSSGSLAGPGKHLRVYADAIGFSWLQRTVRRLRDHSTASGR